MFCRRPQFIRNKRSGKAIVEILHEITHLSQVPETNVFHRLHQFACNTMPAQQGHNCHGLFVCLSEHTHRVFSPLTYQFLDQWLIHIRRFMMRQRDKAVLITHGHNGDGLHPSLYAFHERIGEIHQMSSAAVVLRHLDESTVFQIVETHGGGYSILYKTYEQSVRARDIRDSVENANGTAVLPIAKAKLGSEYCQGKMEGGKCHGEVQKFTLGKLVEFQATGLIVVMSVIIGLLVLCTIMSAIMKKLGLDKVKAPAPAKKAAPAAAAAAPAPAVRAPAHCDWDPNAKSIHPGFTNKQLQAFLGIAAVAALEEHPGLTNEQFLVIATAAATQALGQPCRVTAYRNINSPAWTIVK